MKSELELAFETYWIQCGGDIDDLQDEYQFHSERKWRFDYVYLPLKIAIELEGGTYTQGRHTRGSGFAQDCEKYNSANDLGWHVYRLTSDMLEDDPWGNLRPLVEKVEENKIRRIE